MPTPSRDPAVDVVRGVALLSMFVAHVAPSSGPADILMLSEFLTMPLFAALVGVGAQLGEQRAAVTGERRRWWVSLLVRAGVLIALGYGLDRLGAQVVIVLVHLGVLLLITAGLARLSTLALGALLPCAVAFAVWAVDWSRQEFFTDIAGQNPLGRLVWFTLGGSSYRISTMVAYALLGLLLARWLYGARSPRPGVAGAAGLAGLACAAALLLLDRAHRIDVVAYSGSLPEVAHNLGLTAGVLLTVWALARALPDAVTWPVAAVGGMTLTLYSLHICWLAYAFRVLHPGQSDDSWTNLAILTAGALVMASAWRLAVRRQPWQRGPLEGIEHALIGWLSGGARHIL